MSSFHFSVINFIFHHLFTKHADIKENKLLHEKSEPFHLRHIVAQILLNKAQLGGGGGGGGGGWGFKDKKLRSFLVLIFRNCVTSWCEREISKCRKLKTFF